jgi:hypothetical protein
VGYNLAAAERLLIQRWTPCFNISQNSGPTPLPAGYLPANARLRFRYSLKQLIHQAERVVGAEDAQALVDGRP